MPAPPTTSWSGSSSPNWSCATAPPPAADERSAKEAAREAIAGSIDLPCVLGFGFDATAGDVTGDDNVTVDTSRDGFASVASERIRGRIQVLLVRMRRRPADGRLKRPRARNLFTVFGLPDLRIETTGGGIVVHLNGVDLYDPTTG